MAPLVTLITGCSSGIGMATALRLAKLPNKPYIVFATMRNLAKKGDIEKEAGGALNDTLFIRELDVTKEETIVKTVSQVVSSHGRVDVLINNAGISCLSVLEVTTLDTFRQMYEVNVFGVIRVTQEVLPIMKKQRSGRIINVSSILGYLGMPFFDMYASSKFAVDGFTESLATQLRHFNIWISGVHPGPVATDILKNMEPNNLPTSPDSDPRLDEKTRELITKAQNARFNRDAQPVEEVAEVIQGVVEAKKPHLRNPTNQLEDQKAAERFKDKTGDDWIDKFY